MYRKHGLEIIVRPPHTTHVLQPEDVVSFRPLKIAFRAAKAKLLIDQGLKGHKVGITGEHMLGLLKVAWESAFCREKVVQAWKVTGYIPFTRRVYWNLLRKEEATAATLAEAGRVDPSYKESLGLIAASGGNTAGFAAEHGAEGNKLSDYKGRKHDVCVRLMGQATAALGAGQQEAAGLALAPG